MATPNVGILTTAGKALIDQVNAGKTKITFSKIVFSSMDNSQLSDMQVKDLTAIAPQEVVVSSPETTLDTNSGETRIRATGTNEKLADGVYVKTYGVFAKDDTGSEILYGVTVSPNPNYFPAYDGVTPQAVTYSYKTVIQETSNITMTNSNDVYASQEDLTEALQPYAKTVDVNQQLDKKVNISDMRKPANDVAGIEEVNAKQDKIGYTPADDSKVVHKTGDEEIAGSKTFDTAPIDKATGNPYITKSDLNNGLSTKVTDNKNGTITANNLTYDLSKTGITPLSIYGSGSFNDLPLGTVFTDPPITDGPDTIHSFTTTTFLSNEWGGRKAQIAITDNTNLMYFRVGTSASKGISWQAWVLLSDDSKVAHLSGANNFDTVPTVKNNPLLLASSLPSDLARTGSNQEFTGKNTFDTAPIDKATGNPYITKDGVPAVPSTLADTTKDANFTGKLQKSGIDVATTTDVTTAISTATANMVDSTKATNFTAGLKSGGIDVATAADLKSVADKSWRPLTLANSTSGIILFKDNGDGTASLTGSATFTIAKGKTTLTPAITPPTGYTFTSLKWDDGKWTNNGVAAVQNMAGKSYGVVDYYDVSISNGNICFLGDNNGTYTVTFSPSELTTLSSGIKCNPALVSISKV